MLKMAWVAALLLGMLAGPVWGMDRAELARRLQPGMNYHYRIGAEYRLTDSGNELSVRFGFGIGMEVLEVDGAGNALARIGLHSLTVRMAGPAGPMLDFDSAQPLQPANPAHRILAALPGLSYTVRFAPSGQVLEVKGLDESIRQLNQKLPNLPEKKMLLQNIQARLAFTTLLGMAVNPDLLPAEPVGVGDSWQGSSVLEYLGMTLTADDRFQLAELNEANALIRVDSTLRPVQAGGEQFTGRQQGEIRIDTATGWPVSLRLEQEFAATATQDGKQVVMKGLTTLEPF
ncbi:DUF6263 family protein [Hydrogenispora ethanolica]|uniref:DUF6263 family protein n=1 Tax=Hydrogenispora ethanolica TaxID=1082276 RepID=UPI001FB4F8E4|nr:DUF6263 family protein [Hydrogenispora ethanolica]